MQLLENILLSFESLKANKMRALLTMLGIVIGIASVIGIMSIGNALTINVTEQMQSFGASNIYVVLQEKEDSYSSSSSRYKDEDMLTEQQIRDFYTFYEDSLVNVNYTKSVGNGTARDGRLYANVNIIGVNEGHADVNNLKMLEGRFISEKDMQGYRNVAIVSDKFAENMFGDQDPLMQEVKVTTADGISTYMIIGKYKYEPMPLMGMGGMVSDQDLQTDMYIPVSTANQSSNYKNYSMFVAKTKTEVDAIAFVDTIERYFNKIYRNPDFEIAGISMDSHIGMLTDMLSVISLAIAIIAGISLIVGGIGVMNIMLVSVTERTREIGTRKALGAKKSQIRIQFVTEAVIISLIGGIIGILLGVGASAVVSPMLGSPMVLNVPAITFCVVFSMAIGVFFGYYPANKAASLDPIEALRYE